MTIVTGGSRGIGAAIAEELARAGHDIAIGYQRDEAGARRVAATVRASGVRCLPVRADVSDEREVDDLFAGVADQLGTITGLVNNAGLTGHIGDLADTPIAVVRRVIEVNFLGAVLCARRAVRDMSVRRGGRGGAIVNVSSGAATLGSPHEYVHYAAAKAAVDTLTLGLGKELAGDGIRVNGVAPGIVDTGIHADAGEPERVARVAPRVPMQRAARADEIAPAVAWLLGPQAGYVTSAVLRVAGGL